MNVIDQWKKQLQLKYKLIIRGHEDDEARGGKGTEKTNGRCSTKIRYLILVGYGKNRAVEHSSGRFLCFQDAVDNEEFSIVFFFT